MPLTVLLGFDGTAYAGDIAVQAYARRLGELLDADAATMVIGGMRAFLEGRRVPAGMPPEFHTAEDGGQLLRALADAAGIADADRSAAYRQSREDLARSAFAVDEQPGLVDWLRHLGAEREVWVVTDAPMTAIPEVLDAVGLTPFVDQVVAGAAAPAAIAGRAVEVAGHPSRVLAVGDRWTADLAAVSERGGRTALIDRFGRGVGGPTWRAAALGPMLPALTTWARDPEGHRDAG